MYLRFDMKRILWFGVTMQLLSQLDLPSILLKDTNNASKSVFGDQFLNPQGASLNVKSLFSLWVIQKAIPASIARVAAILFHLS